MAMQRNRYRSVVAWLVLAFTGATYALSVGDISCDPDDPTNCSRWNGTKWVKVTCCGKEKGAGSTTGSTSWYDRKGGGYSNFGEQQGKQGGKPGDDTFTILPTEDGKPRSKGAEKKAIRQMKEALDRLDKLIEHWLDSGFGTWEDFSQHMSEVCDALALCGNIIEAWEQYLATLSDDTSLSDEDRKELAKKIAKAKSRLSTLSANAGGLIDSGMIATTGSDADGKVEVEGYHERVDPGSKFYIEDLMGGGQAAGKSDQQEQIAGQLEEVERRLTGQPRK